MNHLEYVVVILFMLVRVFLIGVVLWFVVSEIRKSGRMRRKKKHEDVE